MRYVDIKGTDMKVSRLALGCMRIGDKSVDEVEEVLDIDERDIQKMGMVRRR